MFLTINILPPRVLVCDATLLGKDWRRRFPYPVIFPLRALRFCGARVAGPHAPRVHVRNQYGERWAQIDYGDNRLLKAWTCPVAHAGSWGELFGWRGKAGASSSEGALQEEEVSGHGQGHGVVVADG